MNRLTRLYPNPLQLGIRGIRQRLGFVGGPRRIRTPDPLIRSQEGDLNFPANINAMPEFGWNGRGAIARTESNDDAAIDTLIQQAEQHQAWISARRAASGVFQVDH